MSEKTGWILTLAPLYFPFLSGKLSQKDLLISSRACDALRNCLPDMLRDATFSSVLRVSIHIFVSDKKCSVLKNSIIQEDQTTRRWLQQLLHNVGVGVGVGRVPIQGGGGFDHMLVS